MGITIDNFREMSPKKKKMKEEIDAVRVEKYHKIGSNGKPGKKYVRHKYLKYFIGT